MPLLGATGGGSAKGFGALANLGYFIRNSLRFRSSASGYLSKSYSSSGTIDTWSFWIKRGKLGSAQTIFGTSNGTNQSFGFEFTSSDTIQVYDYLNVFRLQLYTTQVFRDPSAWYHIVLAIDTTQATSANRAKLYVNGTQITAFSTATYPTQNTSLNIGGVLNLGIGITGNIGGQLYDGYMAEWNFIDGQALTPSDFGKTDAATGQWIPKKYAGTYGTNGFYLKFADASAATAAAIGKDSSGNGNNWTPNNISVTAGVTYDAMIDSPTLSAAASNYATLNPIQTATANITWANANLQAALGTTAAWRTAISTMAVDSGKWYAEFTVTTGVANNSAIGIVPITDNYSGSYLPGSTAGSYGYPSDGTKYNNGTNTSYGNSWTTGDILGIAYDGTNNKIWFSKNGTWQASGDPAAGTNSAFTTNSGVAYYFAVAGAGATQSVFNCNFGQRPFAYTPPAGFKSINTFNLP